MARSVAVLSLVMIICISTSRKRRLQPEIVVAEDAGAAADVFFADGEALLERQRALLDELIREHQHRNLDHAGAVERVIGAHAGLFTRGQVLDPQPRAPWKAREVGLQEALKARGLGGQQTSSQHQRYRDTIASCQRMIRCRSAEAGKRRPAHAPSPPALPTSRPAPASPTSRTTCRS